MRDISSFTHLPEELRKTIIDIYLPAKLDIKNPKIEEDPRGQEYSACRFKINDQNVAFRVAKTTPTKIGQFVTTWQRSKSNNVIEPFNSKDDINFLVIHVADARHQGQFIFDKNILISQGIMSSNDKQGKLAFRICPPWSKPIAKAAIKSQNWQIKYFYSINKNGSADLSRVQQLFKIK
jgi:hypothetical protein